MLEVRRPTAVVYGWKEKGLYTYITDLYSNPENIRGWVNIHSITGETDLIKDYIMDSFSESYDMSSPSTRRRLNEGVDKLSKHYYDMFINRLVYLSEDNEWKEFLSDIGY